MKLNGSVLQCRAWLVGCPEVMHLGLWVQLFCDEKFSFITKTRQSSPSQCCINESDSITWFSGKGWSWDFCRICIHHTEAHTAGWQYHLDEKEFWIIISQRKTRISSKCQYDAWQLFTWLEFGDTLTNALNRSSTLVSQDDREKSLGVTAAQSVGICMTHPRCKELRGTVSFKIYVR